MKSARSRLTNSLTVLSLFVVLSMAVAAPSAWTSEPAALARSGPLGSSEGIVGETLGSTVPASSLFTSTMKIQFLLPIIQKLPTPATEPVPDWLGYFNQFRAQARLAPVVESTDWSHGDFLHSRYMVLNDHVGHSESPGNPWYTPEGLAAAQNGNVFVTSWADAPDESAINFWMTAPFHAIAMLDPELHTTGYGSYREATGLWKMGATLDVRRGRGTLPADIEFPLPYPADGGQMWLSQYYGYEFPDPLTSCPGYVAPTGPPIILQVGSGDQIPEVTAYSLTNDGDRLETCLFDETSYTNPNPGTERSGRIILDNRDAIVMIPRDPLVSGQNYTASVTEGGTTTEWTFSVLGAPANLQPPREAKFQIR